MTTVVATEKFVNWITGQPMALFDATGSVFNASGTTHSVGLVPDPGSTSGNTRYLCEDGTWSTPTGLGVGQFNIIATTTPYDSDPPSGYFATFENFSANQILLTQAEVQAPDESGGFRDALTVWHQDDDTTDYEAMGYRTISQGIRAGVFGDNDGAGTYANTYKDFHGVASYAVANVQWDARGVAAFVGDTVQLGTGVCLNELTMSNPSGANQSVQMAGWLITLSPKVADADASHTVHGISLINVGKDATAAFETYSLGTGGDNGRFDYWLKGDNTDITTGAIIMPASVTGNVGSYIVYDTGDYSFFDTAGSSFGWALGSTNRMQLDASALFPSTDSGLSLGLDAFRWAKIQTLRPITGAGSGLGVTAEFEATFTYSAGTPGVVNTALNVLATASAGVADYVWTTLTQLQNNATAGENVAFYAQAFKNAAGATWAGVFEVEDTTGSADPANAIYGIEVDVQAKGTDANNVRRGIDIIGYRQDGTGTTHAYGGLIIQPSSVDGANFIWKNGIIMLGAGSFQTGINLSGATFSTAAMWIPSDSGILMDTGGNVVIRYNSVSLTNEILIDDAINNAVSYPLTVAHTTSGSPSAGIGSGIKFLTETTAGSNIGGFIANAYSNVGGGTETANMQFGLTVSGAAVATKLTLTGTALYSETSDQLALGSTTNMWSDLFIASGGIINFDAGDVLITHSANALAFTGASSGYSFDATVTVSQAAAATTASGRFVNTTDNASVLSLRIEGDRATPAANDQMYMGFYMSDSAGNQDEFARLGVFVEAVTSGAETGQMRFSLIESSAMTLEMILTAVFLSPGTDGGLDLGSGSNSLNWGSLFLKDGGVINWNNGDVTITHSSNNLTMDGGGFIFNEASGDFDFRMESNGQTHCFFLNAGTDRVGFNTDDPQAQVGIVASATAGTPTSYGFAMCDTGTTLGLTLGTNNTTSYVQSWNGRPLHINGQGNTVHFPAIGTTASAANAYIDNAASNSLLRSTSSIRYKTNVKDLPLEHARKILDFNPITFYSLSEHDDRTINHIGFIAEDVAKVEPRLVNWTNKQPEGVQYDRIIVGAVRILQDHEERITKLERANGEAVIH